MFVLFGSMNKPGQTLLYTAQATSVHHRLYDIGRVRRAGIGLDLRGRIGLREERALQIADTASGLENVQNRRQVELQHDRLSRLREVNSPAAVVKVQQRFCLCT